MDLMKVDVTLPTYSKEEFKRGSWDEYGKTLESLAKKVTKYVSENAIAVHAVVPIIRGGLVPGLVLAHKLHILNIVPVQYKYFFDNGEIQLRKLSKTFSPAFPLPENPTFLLVEGNHCFGITAKTAAKDLEEQFPTCTILYAADNMDYSYQNAVKAKAVFFGKLTNETKALSEDEAKKLGVDINLTLYPWEDLEEEWATVQGKQFPYKDLARQ